MRALAASWTASTSATPSSFTLSTARAAEPLRLFMSLTCASVHVNALFKCWRSDRTAVDIGNAPVARASRASTMRHIAGDRRYRRRIRCTWCCARPRGRRGCVAARSIARCAACSRGTSVAAIFASFTSRSSAITCTCSSRPPTAAPSRAACRASRSTPRARSSAAPAKCSRIAITRRRSRRRCTRATRSHTCSTTGAGIARTRRPPRSSIPTRRASRSAVGHNARGSVCRRRTCRCRVSPPRTQLLVFDWQRFGRIGLYEQPGISVFSAAR